MTGPNHIIENLDQLLEVYDQQPAEASVAKVADHLTPAYRAWLSEVKFAVLATAGQNGLDCSPRGSEEPLFTIENQQTLLLPDWRGNNRLDTLRNLVNIPAIGIICFLPGIGEALRIGGVARISVDPELIERFAKDGKKPRSVVIISIERVYFQCARSIIRSQLWTSEPLEKGHVPTAGQMTRSAFSEFDDKAYDADLLPRQQRTLW
jgi:hypothetical protein